MLEEVTDISSSNSNEIYLVAPFEDDEKKLFSCQCDSCNTSKKYRDWIRHSFFYGMLLPLFWIGNIALYLYFQWYLNHTIETSKIDESELPTLYTLEQKRKRSLVKMNDETLKEMVNIETQGSISSSDDMTLENTNPFSNSKENNLKISNSDDKLFELRYNFIKEAAEDIYESHETLRNYYKRWVLRSTLGIVIDIVIATFIVLVCKYSSYGK